MIAAIATMVLSVSPPPFELAWIRPVNHWPVSNSISDAVSIGALIGGWIGDVHPAWLVATAAGESSFNPLAIGDHGRAFGLCQIHLKTSRQSAPWMTRELLLDPTINLIATGLHYRRLFGLYGRELGQIRYGCGFRCNVVTRGARVKYARTNAILRGERLK